MMDLWLYGYGAMGRLHAEKLKSRPGIKLKIIDPAQGYAEPEGNPDGVIIATPAKTHAEIALRHLEAGRHCLIEKPLSSELKSAEALSRFQTTCPAFIERFCNLWNKAGFLSPRFVQAERISPFSGRGTDVDVVLDLMIHDIDHCLRLMGEEPTDIQAIGIAAKTSRHDMVNARLSFSNGRATQLSASRVSRTSKRRLRLFSDGDYLSIDLQKQNMHRIHWAANQSEPSPIKCNRNDPLTDMHDAFIDAIKGSAPFPISPGDGFSTMKVAMRIREALC